MNETCEGKGKAPEGESTEAARALAASRRLVVKVGSSLLIDSSGEGVRAAWLAGLAADLAALRAEGRQVIAVSSGAVALGRLKLGFRRSARLHEKQAAAAAGQNRLMQAWDDALAPHGVSIAQLLLTYEDTETRRRWLNARTTIQTLLKHSVLPIVNENDSVATEELRYGDNDRLSARVAQMAGSDLLILLSDVDGLYTTDPMRDPGAVHVPVVEQLTAAIEAMAGGALSEGPGSGGMRTKLAAARIATAAGCTTVIASGGERNPLRLLAEGARATVIRASGSPARAYKQWIAGTLATAGTLLVDEGAVRALADGRSLLPAGVLEVSGEFERGSCLSIRTDGRGEVARGISAYNSAEARAIAGCPTTSIEQRLGYCGPDELIHRDDLVMVDR